MNHTVRLLQREDIPGVKKIFKDIDLFTTDELIYMDELVSNSVDSQDESIWVVSMVDSNVQGVLYCAAEMFGPGVWNILFMGVHPDFQRSGVGSSLVAYTYNYLQQKGARKLLVETSGLDEMEPTRKFYQHNSFFHEASITDYYGVGDDKFIYTKEIKRPTA